MNKAIWTISSAVVAAAVFSTTQATTVQASELGATGVKMPVVSTIDQYSNDKIILTKTGSGTQYLDIRYGAVIRDMVTGNILRTVFNDIDTAIVNDKEDLFIGEAGYVYSATKFENEQQFDKDLRLSEVYGFIQNTNTFVGRYYDKLIAYNYDTKQQVFEVTLGSSENLYAIKKDIAVANGNNVTIYDAQGNYVDVLQFSSEVTAIEYDPSGNTLLVGTKNNNVQAFNAQFNYIQQDSSLYQNTANTKGFTYDATGDYLAIHKETNNGYNDYLRLFSLKEQQRIYTELDNLDYYVNYGPILISNNGKFINLGGKTYNAKNIYKSPVSIEIPAQYLTMAAGTELTPTVKATLLDGTTENITAGVTWQSDDLSTAYFDENAKKFKPLEEGSFTLRASYLGFTKDIEINVERSWRNDVEAYLKNNTKSGYYITSMNVKDIYLDQRIYKNAKYKGQYVVTTFTGKKNGSPITYLDVARKGNTAIKFKKVEITANGKTLKKATKTAHYSSGYEEADYIKLSASDRNWIKANVNPNKAVTVKLTGGKKNVTIKLSKVQRDALLKGVLVNDYLQ